VLILSVAGAGRIARAIGAVRGAGHGDRAARLLALAIRGLPPQRAQWGKAMLGELHAVRGRRARLRFSFGCVRSALWMRIAATLVARDRGAHRLRAIVLGAVVAALALPVYGLVRYPSLRAAPDAGIDAAVLVATLLVYALTARTLLPGMTAIAAGARRRAALGGLAVGVAWLCVLAPGALKQWVLVPLVFALVCPLGVAVRTARASRDVRAGAAAALASGLVGGLLVFVAWMTASYLRAGGPYDAQLVRDFRASGAHDLASFAVADDLSTALGLLVVIPIVCGAFGCLAGLVNRPRGAESRG
jgi:hypothetical protein